MVEEEISASPPPFPSLSLSLPFSSSNFFKIQMASFQIDFELSSASGFRWNGGEKRGCPSAPWCNGGNGSEVRGSTEEPRREMTVYIERGKNLRDFYWPRKCLPGRDKDGSRDCRFPSD